jgi:hypothetical protein
MTRQVAQLENQAEAQRALFVGAVDELREQLSAAQIIHRASAGWRNWIEQSAHDNPLQVVSMAALLAYPLWRLARVMPLPMIIAGAGVIFASTARVSTTQAKETLNNTRVRARDVVDRLVDATKQVHDSAARDLQRAQASVAADTNAASEIMQEGARSAAATVKDYVGRAVDSASGEVSNALHAVTPSDTTIQSAEDGAVEQYGHVE